MSAFSLLLALHVAVAVAGTGLSGAIPLGARAARRAGTDAPPGFRSLLAYNRAALALMLLSGVALEILAHGAFHATGWFQISFALLVVAGFAVARCQRALRRRAFDAIERWGWTAVIAVSCIAVLMVLKP